MRLYSIAILIVAYSAVSAWAQEEPGPAPASQPVVAKVVPYGPVDPQSVISFNILQDITAKAKALYEAGKLPAFEKIAAQLSRKRVKLDLPIATDTEPMKPQDLFTRGLESTLIFAIVSDKPKFQVMPATGFVLTASGVAVTNYHVFGAKKNPLGYVAYSHDGKIYTVKEFLAGDEQMDIAIVQLEGEGFKPLRLVERAPVGSDVFVIGAPGVRFWYFTRGMITGYAVIRRKDEPVDTLEISAECARGASGAPVLSASGNVVGMMSSTTTVFYDTEIPPRRPDQQMVFKNCVTSRQILSLIER